MQTKPAPSMNRPTLLDALLHLLAALIKVKLYISVCTRLQPAVMFLQLPPERHTEMDTMLKAHEVGAERQLSWGHRHALMAFLSFKPWLQGCCHHFIICIWLMLR